MTDLTNNDSSPSNWSNLPRDSTLSNRIPKSLHKKLRDILQSKDVLMGDWLIEKIIDEIKIDDDKSNLTLDKFQDPNFKQCPKFYDAPKEWRKYCNAIVFDKKSWKEHDAQLNTILRISNDAHKKSF